MQLTTERPPVRVRLLYRHDPALGANRGFVQLARHLDPRRVAARAVPVDDGHRPAGSEPVRAAARGAVRGGVAAYSRSDLWAECRALGACAARRVDVVHFLDGERGPRYLPTAVRLLRTLAGRARTIATFVQPPELLDELLDRRMVADLDFVTVVSPTQAEWFRSILPPDRVEVVLHGVDDDFFTPAPRPAPQADGPNAPFRCLTVGDWLRDWSALRAVAERLAGERGVEFHVVASCETGLADVANVRHHRALSDEGLLAAYRSADVAFLPLTGGGTASNSLLEGIACGLPLLSTALPLVRAYVPDGEAVLVERNDPDAFCDALLALRRDPDARHARGRAARARAEVLSWKRISRRFVSIYERWRT